MRILLAGRVLVLLFSSAFACVSVAQAQKSNRLRLARWQWRYSRDLSGQPQQHEADYFHRRQCE